MIPVDGILSDMDRKKIDVGRLLLWPRLACNLVDPRKRRLGNVVWCR